MNDPLEAHTFPAPFCACPICKCNAMLTEDAWDKPRNEQICEDCYYDEHPGELR